MSNAKQHLLKDTAIRAKTLNRVMGWCPKCMEDVNPRTGHCEPCDRAERITQVVTQRTIVHPCQACAGTGYCQWFMPRIACSDCGGTGDARLSLLPWLQRTMNEVVVRASLEAISGRVEAVLDTWDGNDYDEWCPAEWEEE